MQCHTTRVVQCRGVQPAVRQVKLLWPVEEWKRLILDFGNDGPQKNGNHPQFQQVLACCSLPTPAL